MTPRICIKAEFFALRKDTAGTSRRCSSVVSQKTVFTCKVAIYMNKVKSLCRSHYVHEELIDEWESHALVEANSF